MLLARIGFLCLACLVIATAGCARPVPATPGANGKLNVVATVGMVGDLIRNVGGKHVAVHQLMGPGVDPHLYKATRDDVAHILAADAVFYCGLMLEGKLSDTLERVAGNKPVFAVTTGLSDDRILRPDGSGGHPDPHAWMDVSLWSRCASSVADKLAELAPEHAAEFAANADKYRQQLAELHEYGQTAMATIPAESRVLVTSHDAFHYFGRAYGIEVLGVQGISTESEAGLQRVNQLVDLLVQRKVPAVFVESSVPRKSIDALVEGAKSRGQEVVIGGELFSDAMGEAGSYEGTYIGMLDHNITLATRSLGGTAPQGGMAGKLQSTEAAQP